MAWLLVLVLALRPGLEDIVLKTSDGEIRLRPYRIEGSGHIKLAVVKKPPGVEFWRERRATSISWAE